MKRKLRGWAAMAAMTLVSANAMAQQNTVNRNLDNAQRSAKGAENAASDAAQNIRNGAAPGQQAPVQQPPGSQAPQNLPDPQGALNQQPPQTFAPSTGAAVQGQGQFQGQQFQGNLNGQPGANGGGAFSNVDPNIRWRYRQQNGRWMYWLPSNQWVVWTNNQWTPYLQANTQPGYQQQGYGPQVSGYANQPQYGNQQYGNQPQYGNQQYGNQQFYGNQQSYGTRPCNQSIYGGQTYPGQTYGNAGGTPYAGQQPGFQQPGVGGPAPYASGYRGVPQNVNQNPNVNPNSIPQNAGPAGAGVQGQSPIEPDINSTPANRDTNPDRNAPKPAPSAKEKQE